MGARVLTVQKGIANTERVKYKMDHEALFGLAVINVNSVLMYIDN